VIGIGRNGRSAWPESALEAGFDAHVAKPPDPDRLAGLLS
jgi:hypothetical protein